MYLRLLSGCFVYAIFSFYGNKLCSAVDNPVFEAACIEGDLEKNRRVVSVCFNTTDVARPSCSNGLLLVHKVTYGVTRDGRCYDLAERDVTCSFELTNQVFPMAPCASFTDLSADCNETFTSSLPSNVENACDEDLDYVQVEYSCYDNSLFVSTVEWQERLMMEGFLLSPRLANDSDIPKDASSRCEIFFETGGSRSPLVDVTAVHLNLTTNQTLKVEEQFSGIDPLVFTAGDVVNGTLFNASARPHIVLTFNASKSSQGDYAIFFKAEVPLRVVCGNTAQAGSLSIKGNDLCPGGWPKLNDACYLIGRNYQNYREIEARAACRACGGDLVDIRNTSQLNSITDKLLVANCTESSPTWWYGATRTGGNGKDEWIFTDGSQADPPDENKQYPQGCSSFFCGRYTGMERTSCLLQSSTLCSATPERLALNETRSELCNTTGPVKPDNLPTLEIKDDPLCPAGWRRMSGGGKCYLFVGDRKLDWAEALDWCGQYTGTLLSVSSLDELNYLRVLVENMVIEDRDLNTWWSGLHLEPAHKYTWWWSTGVTVSRKVNESMWSSGEPDHNLHETCAQLRFQGGFNDDDCSKEDHFICEILIDTAAVMKTCKSSKPPKTTPAPTTTTVMTTPAPTITTVIPTTSVTTGTTVTKETTPTGPTTKETTPTGPTTEATSSTHRAAGVSYSRFKEAVIGLAVFAIILFIVGFFTGAARKAIIRKCCSCCRTKTYDSLLLQDV